MAKVKIVKKKLPNAIAYHQIGDPSVRNVVMKLKENERVMMEQISTLQDAVIELQR